MNIVMYILSAVGYFFGVMFVWSAFDTKFDGSALLIGLITLAVASVILIIVTRKSKAEKAAKNVTYKVDLGGNLSVNPINCKNCGAPIPAENITIAAGAPTVTCPFCGCTYQISEEPKW